MVSGWCIGHMLQHVVAMGCEGNKDMREEKFKGNDGNAPQEHLLFPVVVVVFPGSC